MRFSEHFRIGCGQSGLDFIDVPLGTDLRLFVDPYALATTSTPWCESCHALASGFFQQVLERLRAGDRRGAVRLVGQLREDNRTRFGYSRRRPQGSGLGHEKAEPFLDAIASSEAFASGRIEDIEDAALLVNGIGYDIISDMMTNVLRIPLAQYTREQCELHAVRLEARETTLGWDQEDGWVEVEVDLPVYNGRSILLVPRSIVRKDLSLQPGQFLKDFLDEYYENGHPQATRALERMLQHVPKKRNGKVHRTRVRDELKKHGPVKNAMSKIVGHCPEALSGYKRRARTYRPCLTPVEIEELQRTQMACDASLVIREMRSAARNADDVARLARASLGVFVSALHPVVQHPCILELNGLASTLSAGVVANSGTRGIFFQAKRRAPNIAVVSCGSEVDQRLVEHVRSVDVFTNAGAGLTFLVGTDIAHDLRARRSRLVGEGLFPVSMSELVSITELDAGDEASTEAFDSLLSA